jgi:hypothetical protein
MELVCDNECAMETRHSSTRNEMTIEGERGGERIGVRVRWREMRGTRVGRGYDGERSLTANCRSAAIASGCIQPMIAGRKSNRRTIGTDVEKKRIRKGKFVMIS